MRVEADGSVHVTTRLVLVIAVVVLFVLLLRRRVAVWQLRGGESACVCASERGYRRAENDSPKGIYTQHIFPKTQLNNSTQQQARTSTSLSCSPSHAQHTNLQCWRSREGTARVFLPSSPARRALRASMSCAPEWAGRARYVRSQYARARALAEQARSECQAEGTPVVRRLRCWENDLVEK